MDQSSNHSQPTHPQNPHKRFKRSHDPTPSTDVLRPENLFDNRQEGLDCATTNTSTSGSHAQHRPDVFLSPLYRPPGTSPAVTFKRLQGLKNPTANDRDSDQYNLHRSPTAWSATQDVESSSANDNSSSEMLPQWNIYQGDKMDFNDREVSLDRFEESTSARIMTETSRQGVYHHGSAEDQVHNSRGQSPHTAIPAESVAISDGMQSNAFFQNAHGFNISGSPRFQNHNIGVTNVYREGTDPLDKHLKGHFSFNALHNSSVQDPSRQCHPGTRENVLKRLRDWVDNPNPADRIFWLYGPAGAGKSAIAQTIARLYHHGEVAATFFFFGSDISRNDANRLFTTIAWQIAFSIPGTKDRIVHALNQRPHLPMCDVKTQFDQLIAQPSLGTLKEVTSRHVAPVVIIDGIDECTDENLQRRFLKVIGDAVTDDRFPLRFLIVSRPELHIEQTVHRFKNPILTVDLAKLDDANRDIEKYLVDEFSRIASEQGIDPTWPSPKIIHDIVYKSSGNFIFASLVIKFVGDPYSFAKTQLDIVLNMKPRKTMSPFAILDQLFLEILRRVPDQDFLKRYLAVLTARISVSERYGDLYKDDAVLMHVSVEELHANLRRMRSLLIFEPRIDVHHLSFIDFLYESSRSSEYYVGKRGGIRRYLDLFVDSFVRYVTTAIEHPDHHNAPHFSPIFRAMLKSFPPEIELPVNEWQEVMQPLPDLLDNLLQLPNFASTWYLMCCDECSVSYLLRELLHIGLHLGRFKGQPDGAVQPIMNIRKRRGVVSSTTTETEKKINKTDMDSLLLSLPSHLPETMENWSLNEEVIQLTSAILRFDSAEVTRRVRFVSDAQKLVDLLVYLIDEKNALSRIRADAARSATMLALTIFARIPILPLATPLNGNKKLDPDPWIYGNIPIQILSQTIFASRILDRRYIVPVWVVEDGKDGVKLVCDDADGNDLSMKEWRQRLIPSSMTTIQIMLKLGKAIQYFYSMGVVPEPGFSSDNVVLDPSLHPKLRCWCSTSQFLLDKRWKERFSIEDNTFSLGCLFYELFSGIDTKPMFLNEMRRCIIERRPSLPEIPEYAWQLLQRCCAKHPKSRPTIDEVVQEMESWNIN